MDSIRNLWKQGGLEPPKLLLGVNTEGETFLVIDDHQSIITLMNTTGKIYAVAAFRCQQNGEYLACGEPMHIISCLKYETSKEQYANQTMIPYLNSLLDAQQRS